MADSTGQLGDEELARRTQAGSLEAFEALVYRYEGRLYSFVAHCCRHDTDAHEITQDTFVRAFQAIGQFDPRRSFAAWLFTIARRKCIDRQRGFKQAAAEIREDERADDADPFELLARHEEQEDLWRLAKETLPDTQFQALWLRYAEDMSVASLAHVLGKTETHAKVLLFRAREALGRKLKSARSRSEVVRGEASFPRAAVPCAVAPTEKGML